MAEYPRILPQNGLDSHPRVNSLTPTTKHIVNHFHPIETYHRSGGSWRIFVTSNIRYTEEMFLCAKVMLRVFMDDKCWRRIAEMRDRASKRYEATGLWKHDGFSVWATMALTATNQGGRQDQLCSLKRGVFQRDNTPRLSQLRLRMFMPVAAQAKLTLQANQMGMGIKKVSVNEKALSVLFLNFIRDPVSHHASYPY